MDDSQRGTSDLLLYVERLHGRIRELMAANTKLKRKIKELEGTKNLSSPQKKAAKKVCVKSN